MNTITVEPPNNTDQYDTSPQEIRITNHGKMQTWVAFALEHLQVRILELCLTGRHQIFCFCIPSERRIRAYRPAHTSHPSEPPGIQQANQGFSLDCDNHHSTTHLCRRNHKKRVYQDFRIEAPAEAFWSTSVQ